MADRDEPVAQGVPLRSYARVLAARAEGASLERALVHGAVDPALWPAVDSAFTQLLAAAAAGEPALLDLFDEKLRDAQDELRRRTPPLDEDLGSWLDFLRGLAESDDPLELLARSRLRETDLLRLQRLWAPRLEADASLRAEAARVLADAPRAIAVPPPAEPPIAAVRERPPLPSPPAVVEIPRLSVPLPEPEEAPPSPSAVIADTAPLVPGSLVKRSPFAGTAFALDLSIAAVTPFTKEAPAPATPATPITNPILPRKAPPALGGTSLALDVPRGPAVPFAAPPPPPPPPMPTAFRGAPDPGIGARIDPGQVPRKAPSALAGTSLALDVPRGPAVPFTAPPPPPPLPQPTYQTAPPGLPGARIAPGTIPHKAPQHLAATSLAIDVERAPALPFSPGAQPVPPAPPPPSAPVYRRAPPNLTGTSLALDVPSMPAVPFTPAHGGAAQPEKEAPAPPSDPGDAGSPGSSR